MNAQLAYIKWMALETLEGQVQPGVTFYQLVQLQSVCNQLTPWGPSMSLDISIESYRWGGHIEADMGLMDKHGIAYAS